MLVDTSTRAREVFLLAVQSVTKINEQHVQVIRTIWWPTNFKKSKKTAPPLKKKSQKVVEKFVSPLCDPIKLR